MDFEAKISGYLFRMTSDGMVEVSHASDKDKECIMRFFVKDCNDQVAFEKECAFWYMENSRQLEWYK